MRVGVGFTQEIMKYNLVIRILHPIIVVVFQIQYRIVLIVIIASIFQGR